MTNAIIVASSTDLILAPLFAPTPNAARLEFFTAQVNNDHIRKAYLDAIRRFGALLALVAGFDVIPVAGWTDVDRRLSIMRFWRLASWTRCSPGIGATRLTVCRLSRFIATSRLRLKRGRWRAMNRER
jgi:hypothetical protein